MLGAAVALLDVQDGVVVDVRMGGDCEEEARCFVEQCGFARVGWDRALVTEGEAEGLTEDDLLSLLSIIAMMLKRVSPTGVMG